MMSRRCLDQTAAACARQHVTSASPSSSRPAHRCYDDSSSDDDHDDDVDILGGSSARGVAGQSDCAAGGKTRITAARRPNNCIANRGTNTISSPFRPVRSPGL